MNVNFTRVWSEAGLLRAAGGLVFSEKAGAEVDSVVEAGRRPAFEDSFECLERPAALRVLAVAARDVCASGDDAVGTVHNIGSAASGTFEVALKTACGEGRQEAARFRVAGLTGITDLQAARREVAFRGVAWKPGSLDRVVVDPYDQVEES